MCNQGKSQIRLRSQLRPFLSLPVSAHRNALQQRQYASLQYKENYWRSLNSKFKKEKEERKNETPSPSNAIIISWTGDENSYDFACESFDSSDSVGQGLPNLTHHGTKRGRSVHWMHCTEHHNIKQHATAMAQSHRNAIQQCSTITKQNRGNALFVEVIYWGSLHGIFPRILWTINQNCILNSYSRSNERFHHEGPADCWKGYF